MFTSGSTHFFLQWGLGDSPVVEGKEIKREGVHQDPGRQKNRDLRRQGAFLPIPGQAEQALGKRKVGRRCSEGLSREAGAGDFSPMLERAEERSMMVLLPGLLSTDRLASERSAVTRVMEILG